MRVGGATSLCWITVPQTPQYKFTQNTGTSPPNQIFIQQLTFEKTTNHGPVQQKLCQLERNHPFHIAKKLPKSEVPLGHTLEVKD